MFEKDGDNEEATSNQNGNGDESFMLPAISVTGYATPRLMLHPSAPRKMLWDLCIGALIVYRLSFAFGDSVCATECLSARETCLVYYAPILYVAPPVFGTSWF